VLACGRSRYTSLALTFVDDDIPHSSSEVGQLPGVSVARMPVATMHVRLYISLVHVFAWDACLHGTPAGIGNT
jgi:hypothetical protein